MKKRFDAAAARGKVLRYMGRLTADGKATVGVAELDKSHAFANIALTDNVVRYATARYNTNPLIVQGPGAGPEVTAAGVFADLLRVCSLSRSAPVSDSGAALSGQSNGVRAGVGGERRHRLRHPGLLGRRAGRQGHRRAHGQAGRRDHRFHRRGHATFRAIRRRTPRAARCSPCSRR